MTNIIVQFGKPSPEDVEAIYSSTAEKIVLPKDVKAPSDESDA